MIWLWACGGSLRNAPLADDTRAPSEQRPDDVERDTAAEGVHGPGDDTAPRPELLCELALSCSSDIPDEPEVPCWFTVTDGYGDLEYDGWAGVELRGRSSLNAPKHQYGVELWADEAGFEKAPANLGGMGQESDWVLNGAYYDRSLFRNVLAFDLFADMGHYAPEVRYCELTLDDEPLGIYHLVERVKRDDDRLDLADETGTGEHFVLYLDDEGGFANAQGYGYWSFISPHAASLPPGTSDAVQSWLEAWQANYQSGGAGLAWLDLDSTVDLVLLEELAKNNDAYYLSLYLWRDGGAMHWVPWDLDLSMGQPSYNDNENPETWIAYRPSFIAALGTSQEFRTAMRLRWDELRAGPLADDAVQAHIDDYLAVMEPGLASNWAIWDITTIQFSGYLYEVGSYEEEVERVRTFLEARMAWMDGAIETW